MGRLFWKVFLGFWFTLVLAAVGVGVAVLVYSEAQDRSTGERLEGRRVDWGVAAVALALRHGGVSSALTLLRQADEPLLRAVLIVDSEGKDVLGRPVPHEAWEHAQERLEQSRDGRRRDKRDDGHADDQDTDHGRERPPRALRTQTPDGLRYVVMAAPTHPVPEPVLPWTLQLLAAGLASLLFSGGLAWYLTRPLRHLQHASRRLAEGALDTRVSPLMGRRRDEIADLGRDFDYMAARLQSLVDAQRRLLHDVSHELRSPLARLQTAIALLRQQPDKTLAMVERIEREIGRLNALVGEILALSRMEAGVTGEEDYIDLGALLRVIAEDADFEAQTGGTRVRADCPEGVLVRGRAELLRRALENVVRNALQHGGSGVVDVTMQRSADGGEVTVQVCDRGPGLPEAQLDQVFEAFFAGEASQARGGAGLGLAIARRAVGLHQGHIAARNREGGGLCVEIRLPCSDVPEDT